MDIIKKLQQELQIKQTQVESAVKLIDEGNTIPFIARYRKEMTGSLDDQVLRELFERLMYLRGMDEKRQQVTKILGEQGTLTEELSKKLENAETLTEIDDIYRPFRPKRRTRAMIAKEKGLQPLADIIWGQRLLFPISEHAAVFIDEEKGVCTVEDALAGAQDIIAEMISDDADLRKVVRAEVIKSGNICSKGEETEENVYKMYLDFYEPIKKIADHRVLALNRGEKEKALSVSLEMPQEEILNKLVLRLIKRDSQTKEIMISAIEDSLKRLIEPSIEREIRAMLTEKAQEGAIKVFSQNLKQLLLQPPIKDKIVLAVDPAFRTGCKIAVIDQTGKALETGVIYPTPPQNKIEEAKKKLKSWIEKYGVEVICIGNGTASRESEAFIADMLKEIDQKIYYIIVNEAGASVYSASKLGADEFPEFDVALRSAVSIGRRLQDPLAELVKIDPKAIGVGQYQHDMNPKRLDEALGGVVEGCVNSVGVDLNTASPSLLSYISGISSTVSKNILKYREEKGKFKSRKELLKVPKLGPKAYEQCAGFLRIGESKEVLDITGVHPESYAAAHALMEELGINEKDIRENKIKGLKTKVSSYEKTAEKLGIGVPTLEDIINELEKPGRDPREDMPIPVLRSDILSVEDLQDGMVLTGTVRNVIDFGVFVDIGVHQDGLVHISQICDKYIKHPLDVLSIGDIVKVKVLSIDPSKKRISLTMKNIV